MQTSKLLILMLVCSFLSNISHSQDITKDTIQANQIIKLADSLNISANYKRASHYYKQATKIYKKYKFWDNYINTLNKLGIVLYYQGKIDDAKITFEKAIQEGEIQLGHEHSTVAKSYQSIGEINRILGEYNLALKQFQKALNLKSQHGF